MKKDNTLLLVLGLLLLLGMVLTLCWGRGPSRHGYGSQPGGRLPPASSGQGIPLSTG